MGDHGEWYASEGRNTSEASIILSREDFEKLKTIMRKSEPMKAVENLGTALGHCPNCGEIIDKVSNLQYCPYCGQRIDWGDKK